MPFSSEQRQTIKKSAQGQQDFEDLGKKIQTQDLGKEKSFRLSRPPG